MAIGISIFFHSRRGNSGVSPIRIGRTWFFNEIDYFFNFLVVY
jgi:hypothetical protein